MSQVTLSVRHAYNILLLNDQSVVSSFLRRDWLSLSLWEEYGRTQWEGRVSFPSEVQNEKSKENAPGLEKTSMD